jgi:hypothetical protein
MKANVNIFIQYHLKVRWVLNSDLLFNAYIYLVLLANRSYVVYFVNVVPL